MESIPTIPIPEEKELPIPRFLPRSALIFTLGYMLIFHNCHLLVIFDRLLSYVDQHFHAAAKNFQRTFKCDKPYVIVIRNLHPSTDPADIACELESIGHQAVSVTNVMYTIYFKVNTKGTIRRRTMFGHILEYGQIWIVWTGVSLVDELYFLV